jgi:hypothetical protein
MIHYLRFKNNYLNNKSQISNYKTQIKLKAKLKSKEPETENNKSQAIPVGLRYVMIKNKTQNSHDSLHNVV